MAAASWRSCSAHGYDGGANHHPHGQFGGPAPPTPPTGVGLALASSQSAEVAKLFAACATACCGGFPAIVSQGYDYLADLEDVWNSPFHGARQLIAEAAAMVTKLAECEPAKRSGYFPLGMDIIGW